MAAILVLGTGWTKSSQLVNSAQLAVDELGLGDTVEKIIHIMRIFELAPSALSALAIDGKVVSSGPLLTPDQIKHLLVLKYFLVLLSKSISAICSRRQDEFVGFR